MLIKIGDNKMAKKIPQWVQGLSPGVYSMAEIMSITGLTNCAVRKQLLKYGCEIKKIPGPRNLMIYQYLWKGLK